MPYVKQSLKTLLMSLENGTRFREQHITLIMYNALLGLAMLHKNGIVHRDIQPSNLLVNNNCQVFICDFRLARL